MQKRTLSVKRSHWGISGRGADDLIHTALLAVARAKPWGGGCSSSAERWWWPVQGQLWSVPEIETAYPQDLGPRPQPPPRPSTSST